MIIAEKIVCTLVDAQEVIGECTLPAPGLLDWASGLGGIISAAAAICFGFWAIRQAQKERTRAEEAERRVRLGKVCDKINDAYSKISESETLDQTEVRMLTIHFQTLRQALAPFGPKADEFYAVVSEFALVLSSYLQNLFNYEAESDYSVPSRVQINFVDVFIIGDAVGRLRSGLNTFVYAETDEERAEALRNFQTAVEHCQIGR